ncbi:selenide,water dikinase [Alkalibacillus flavidus]|uniref:Selenide,water dikinase n=1 Tax=Alkalibacillus flavidus TaxID=546021 RepID=A0ABV2KRL9_9BACI
MLSQVESKSNDDHVLYSQNGADDAGVYYVQDDLAMVQSVDYFTPIVDDPYQFGQIAVANAVSDIYAMGADVKTALNIVGFSVQQYGPDILTEILQGAEDKMAETGGSIIGGHSIDDAEPKFGLAVTGFAHPDNIWLNSGAQPGDQLILTKPIGTGIATTAIKKGLADDALQAETIKWMSQLNKLAADTLKSYHPSAVTDVTGFGLIGHAYEMAANSQVQLSLEMASIPVISGVQSLLKQGAVPGGSKANWSWLSNDVTIASHLEENRLLLADAVTSGGLLIALNQDEAADYVDALNRYDDHMATIIGDVKGHRTPHIYIN